MPIRRWLDEQARKERRERRKERRKKIVERVRNFLPWLIGSSLGALIDWLGLRAVVTIGLILAGIVVVGAVVWRVMAG